MTVRCTHSTFTRVSDVFETAEAVDSFLQGEAFARNPIGVVYDPLLDECFRARRGGGADLNGRRLKVSTEHQLEHALAATGFAYDVQRSREDNLNHFASFIKTVRAVRRDGSAALDLCYVAAGRVDGFWEQRLHPWDMSAASLMVEESGGRVSRFDGTGFDTQGGQIVASNGRIHDQMLAVIANGPR